MQYSSENNARWKLHIPIVKVCERIVQTDDLLKTNINHNLNSHQLRYACKFYPEIDL